MPKTMLRFTNLILPGVVGKDLEDSDKTEFASIARDAEPVYHDGHGHLIALRTDIDVALVRFLEKRRIQNDPFNAKIRAACISMEYNSQVRYTALEYFDQLNKNAHQASDAVLNGKLLAAMALVLAAGHEGFLGRTDAVNIALVFAVPVQEVYHHYQEAEELIINGKMIEALETFKLAAPKELGLTGAPLATIMNTAIKAWKALGTNDNIETSNARFRQENLERILVACINCSMLYHGLHYGSQKEGLCKLFGCEQEGEFGHTVDEEVAKIFHELQQNPAAHQQVEVTDRRLKLKQKQEQAEDEAKEIDGLLAALGIF